MRVLTLFAMLAFPSMSFAQPAVPAPTPPDLTGTWSGYWVSDKNGHTGPMRAKFTQLNLEQYKVVYSGRYAKILPFRYSTTMDVIGTGADVVMLTAEKPLGLGGSYRTVASGTATNFDATYTSPRDRGRFVMTRR